MARTKRTSTILEEARQRLAGMKSISPPPDFGASLTLAGYETDINAVTVLLDSYNEQLSALDQAQNELQAAEKALQEKKVRMLSAAEAQYGSDSSEYEQAGGTRRSDRKRPGPKKPTTKAPTT
jgi:hypothetical protein